ncbi:unnamed protein product [Urochloa humidicola]
MQNRVVEDQMEAMKAVVEDLPSELPKVVVDMGGGQVMEAAARKAHLDAMKALVGDLATAKADADKKGKGTAIDGGGTSCGNEDDDDWGEDELLFGGDSE